MFPSCKRSSLADGCFAHPRLVKRVPRALSVPVCAGSESKRAKSRPPQACMWCEEALRQGRPAAARARAPLISAEHPRWVNGGLNAWCADARLALGYRPWSLLAQDEPLPERVLSTCGDAIVDQALGGWARPPRLSAGGARRLCRHPWPAPSWARDNRCATSPDGKPESRSGNRGIGSASDLSDRVIERRRTLR